MDKRLDQAITNLQTICNLALDDDTILDLASSTADLLGDLAGGGLIGDGVPTRGPKPLMDEEFFDLVSQFLSALDAEKPHPAEEIPIIEATSTSHKLGEEIGYMLQDYFSILAQWKQAPENLPE